MPPTFCPCNKPILKRPSAPSSLPPPTTTTDEDSFGLLHIDPSVLGQPTVRFPPTPALVTRTFLAHPSTEYDRTPIVVAPNACKLPARGCPGRTYLPSSPSSSPSRSHLSSHSNMNSNANGQERKRGRRGRGRSPATRRTHASSTTGVALPPLVPDLTSSSSDDDDSDRVPNPFVNIDAYTSSIPAYSSSKSKNTIDDHSDEVDRAFARFRSSQMHHGTDDALSIPPTPTLKPTLVALSPSLSLSRHSHSHTTPHSPSLNLTLSDSPPPVPSPLSNPTSPVSFNMRPSTTSSAHSISSTASISSSPRASRWERAVRRNTSGSGGERERSSERRSRRRERDGKEGKESKEGKEGKGEKEGFKRFGDFEGRSVLSGCSLRVDDGGCFGGF